MATSMESFASSDQELLRRLYAELLALFATLQTDEPHGFPSETQIIGAAQVDGLFQIVSQLGTASYAANPSPALAKTIHDVRGGGLTPLLGELQFAQRRGMIPGAHGTLYSLVRDHLKIMRNALLGLDDPKRDEDLLFKVHSTDLLVEKWDGTRFAGQNGEVLVRVDCAESVAIAECCVEFGAVDRVLYNLFNNACRHTADGTVQLGILPVPERDSENLRFVLLNPLVEEEINRLKQTDLRTLFRAGVSTTGSGYGLNVAADFVSNAFGLATPEKAVEGHYLGATILAECFAVWFHWPIVSKS